MNLLKPGSCEQPRQSSSEGTDGQTIHGPVESCSVVPRKGSSRRRALMIPFICDPQKDKTTVMEKDWPLPRADSYPQGRFRVFGRGKARAGCGEGQCGLRWRGGQGRWLRALWSWWGPGSLSGHGMGSAGHFILTAGASHLFSSWNLLAQTKQ